MTDDGLQDRRILIVEDEYLLAFELKETLVDAGAVVVGPVPSVTKALALVEQTHELDGAILDFNLGGELVFPVADQLIARGVPFMFITGYDERDIPAPYERAPCVGKPVEPRHLARALTRLLGDRPAP